MTAPKEAVSAAPIPQGSHALAELRDLTECRCPADYKNRGRVACDCNHAYREDVDELAAALAASEARVAELGERYARHDEILEAYVHFKFRAEVAEQSLAEARKDAERWRWLRGNVWAGWMRGEGFFLNCDEPESEWDAAIDAMCLRSRDD